MAEDYAKLWRPGAPRPASAPRLSKTRLALAFLVAAASDVVSYGTAFVPPVQWTVDLCDRAAPVWAPGVAVGTPAGAGGRGHPRRRRVSGVAARRRVGGPVG